MSVVSFTLKSLEILQFYSVEAKQFEKFTRPDARTIKQSKSMAHWDNFYELVKDCMNI